MPRNKISSTPRAASKKKERTLGGNTRQSESKAAGKNRASQQAGGPKHQGADADLDKNP